MNILRRGVRTTETAGNKIDAEISGTRRIEVTVERETVSVLVRGQPKAGAKQPASADARPELEPPKLPASSPTPQDKHRR